jgi:hypothetical protein
MVTPVGSPITLRIDHSAAEALLTALERTEITDAEIDRLLALRGVRAMVDNTTKYLPTDTREVFRDAVKEFVTTRKSTIGHFGLESVVENAAAVRTVIAGLDGDPKLAPEVTGPVNRHRPESGPLEVTAYCVVGGVSHGFVPDGDPEPAFFMAIDRSMGDLDGVKLNMTHEVYHVAQRAARAQVPGLDARMFDPATAPEPVRLLTTVLEEGTATYVAEATPTRGSGPYIEMWRSGYAKNAGTEKITSNFELFDRLLAELRGDAITWDEAYVLGFADIGPPLYFVGYEMAKALVRRHGPAHLGTYFQRHSAAFFRDYVALHRESPGEAPARFSADTDSYIESLGTT